MATAVPQGWKEKAAEAASPPAPKPKRKRSTKANKGK